MGQQSTPIYVTKKDIKFRESSLLSFFQQQQQHQHYNLMMRALRGFRISYEKIHNDDGHHHHKDQEINHGEAFVRQSLHMVVRVVKEHVVKLKFANHHDGSLEHGKSHIGEVVLKRTNGI